MCMQVAAIYLFFQQSLLSFLLLIIVLLAPSCPIDNVSIDVHLLIHNQHWLPLAFSYSFQLCELFLFHLNIQISLSSLL